MGKTDKVAYQFLKGENENLRAEIEAKDAEIRTWEEKTMAQQCRAIAAEERARELEDLQRRTANASKLKDLQRINDLEQWREEDAETIANFARAEVEKDDLIAALKQELAEAREDTERLDWLDGHKEIYANTRAMKTRGSYYEWQLASDSGIWNGHTFRAAIDNAREE
jgi:hypothetical protein